MKSHCFVSAIWFYEQLKFHAQLSLWNLERGRLY